MNIKVKCAECGMALWGDNLSKIGDLYYCRADYERLSTAERRKNERLVRDYDNYRIMFDGTAKVELVTNGSFATDTDWTKGTGWTISSGKASCDGTQSAASVLSQSRAKELGVYYNYKFTISNYSAGSVRVQTSASHYGTARSADGTYEEKLLQFYDYNLIAISADADFVGSIDNFSVRRE